MGWKSLTLRGCGRHSERCYPFHHHKVLCPLLPKQGSRVCCHLLISSCVAFRTQERVLGCKLPRQARPFTLCLSRHVGMAAQSSPWAALTGFFCRCPWSRKANLGVSLVRCGLRYRCALFLLFVVVTFPRQWLPLRGQRPSRPCHPRWDRTEERAVKEALLYPRPAAQVFFSPVP